MKKICFAVLSCVLALAINLNAQNPTIKMVKIDSIGTHTAHFYGNLESLGDWSVKNIGFIYAPITDPQEGDTFVFSKIAWKATEYDFKTFSLANYLHPGTQYWVKAWVTKGSGKNVDTCYSDPKVFQTLPAVCPTVEMYDSVNVGLTKIKVFARIDSLGDAEASLGCGFICSDSTEPTMRTENIQVVKVENTLTEYMMPLEYEAEFTGLAASTTYYCRAWTAVKYTENRVDTCYSDQIAVTTHDACDAVPTKLDTAYVLYNKVKLIWIPAEGQTVFEVEYGPAGHTQGSVNKVIVDDADSLTIPGLESNRTYTASVRAVCGTKKSAWSDIKSFRTKEAPCEKISALHVDDLTFLNAKISWTSGSPSQTAWDVLYARKDHAYPNTPYTVYKTEFSPLGLKADTEYKIKVRANCFPLFSDWSDEVFFTTNKSSIQQPDNSENISVYPNPSNDIIYLSGNGSSVKKIEVYSQIGSLVYSSDKFVDQINLSDFGSGIYYIQITTSDAIQTEKIIIN